MLQINRNTLTDKKRIFLASWRINTIKIEKCVFESSFSNCLTIDSAVQIFQMEN